MKNYLYLFFLTFIAVSCSSDDSSETLAEIQVRNENEILSLLEQRNITDAIKTESGMYVAVVNEGSSEKPKLSNTVTVNYEGRLIDGTLFDGTTTSPISFPLTNVILGWQEGIPFFGRGGNGTLYIPSWLAYGNRPPRGTPIPENAVLVFDVEVVDF